MTPRGSPPLREDGTAEDGVAEDGRMEAEQERRGTASTFQDNGGRSGWAGTMGQQLGTMGQQLGTMGLAWTIDL